MQYEFAPMEGLTDSIYRQLHHKYFSGISRYYTPFFSPTGQPTMTARLQRELPPVDAISYTLVPQILTKHSEHFIQMAELCKELGYTSVNLNLGCPSGTVTAKGKGSGMLRDTDSLCLFLEAVFKKSPLPISVKTRIGYHDTGEFPRLVEIFNQYPIQYLIIHPRVRDAMYKGSVDMQAFAYASDNCKMPICYNGNLCTLQDIDSFSQNFPGQTAVMLGRGLIADPGMLAPGGTQIGALESFCVELLEAYTEAFGNSRNAMFRLKENWRYLICKFDGGEKLYKRLRKTTDISEYKSITQEIFHSLPLRNTLAPDW